MKMKTKYTEGPTGKFRIVKDFLPPPEVLAFSPVRVKVTMSLSQSSLDFFKKEAKRYHTPYQKMIRNLLDAYVARQAL